MIKKVKTRFACSLINVVVYKSNPSSKTGSFNATKIEKKGIHFKTDVFAAVAVVDAKAL